MASEAAALFVTVDARISGLESGLSRAEARSEQAASTMRRSADRASLSFSQMGKSAVASITSAAHKAKLVGAVFGGFAIKKGIDQVVGFDRAMQNVNSIAQLSDRSLGNVKKRVLELAGQTAQAPVTLAEGLYDLVSSGFNAKQSLTILRSSAKAATAGLTDTATSTKAVAAVLNAYHLPASAAAKVSDTLFQTVNRGVISFEELSSVIGDVLPFASSLGVGLNQVGAAVSTMTKEGLSGAESTTRLKNTLIAFIKPSKDMAAAIKSTGFTSGEALVKAKGFQGALEAVIGTTDGTKQQVATLFPNIRALGGALALTGNNSRSAAGDLRNFRDVTGATDKALKEQAKSASYTWNKIKAEVSAAVISIAQKDLPKVQRAMKDVEAIFQRKDISLDEKFHLSFEAIKKDLGPLGDELQHALNAASPALASAAGDLGKLAVHAFVEAFKGSGFWGKLVLGGWLFSKLGGFGAFRGMGVRAGASLGTGIAEGAAPAMASGFRGRLGATMRGIGKAVIGTQIALGIGDALSSGLPVGDAIQQGLSTATAGLVPSATGQKAKETAEQIKKLKAAFTDLGRAGSSAGIQKLASGFGQIKFAGISGDAQKFAGQVGKAAYMLDSLNKKERELMTRKAYMEVLLKGGPKAATQIAELVAKARNAGHERDVLRVLVESGDSEALLRNLKALVDSLHDKTVNVNVVTHLLGGGRGGALGGNTAGGVHGKLGSAKRNPFLDLAQSDIESTLSDTQSKADDLVRQLADKQTSGTGKHKKTTYSLHGKARKRAQARLQKLQNRLALLHPAEDRALRTALGLGGSDVDLADAEATPGKADDITALRDRIGKDSSRIGAIRRKLKQKGVSRQHRLSLQSELAGLIGDRSQRQSALEEAKAPTGPTASDFANMNVALASLTKSLDDDKTAADQLVTARQKELDDAKAGGDPGKIADAASNLKSAIDAQTAIGADAPTAVDFAQAKVALAGLTDSLDDDKSALQNDLIPALQNVLATAQAAGDPRQVADAANNLKGAIDQLASLTADLIPALQQQNAVLQESVDAANKALAVSQSETGVLRRALANEVGLVLGARAGMSRGTPTKGATW